MAYANFMSQSQGLLQPDVALFSLGRFYDDAVARNPALQEAMGSKTRTGFALRTLLGDPETAQRAIELATIFATTQREPVVLHMPSPMQWLIRTHRFSGATTTAGLTADNAENVAMYIADWLRGFAPLSISGILLDDQNQVADTVDLRVPLGTYSPITNLTNHYGWTLGLYREDAIELHSSQSGSIIPAEFWLSGHGVPADGSFLFAEIPENAVPEEVLGHIRSLV